MTTQAERSKYLSYLLRHKPEAAKLTLDKEGWCSIAQLLANTDFTRVELLEIVDTDAKGRYTVNEPRHSSVPATMIRAAQGHSTQGVKMTFKVAIPPVKLFHGADDRVIDVIMKQGLLPIKRHHVHLSADIGTAEMVGGRRKSGFTILSIDAKQMVTDGHKFFISENGVWLSDHVPPNYLSKEKP